MSYFTTKCDFYDDVESMSGGFKAWFERHNRNVEIEVDSKHFMVSCRDDVLPYYTRIVCVMCANKGHAYYKLSSIPYTQEMIEERKKWIEKNKKDIKRWSKNPEKNQRKIAWAEKDIRSLERCIKWIEDLEQKFAKYVELNRGKDEEVWLW